MDDLKHENIHKLPLDVTKDDSVKDVVRIIIEKEGQIDRRYNNAGMSGTGAHSSTYCDHSLCSTRDVLSSTHRLQYGGDHADL